MRGATMVTARPSREDDAAFIRGARLPALGRPAGSAMRIDELLLRIERIGLAPYHVFEAGGCLRHRSSRRAAELPEARRICGFVAENFREDINSTDIAAVPTSTPSTR